MITSVRIITEDELFSTCGSINTALPKANMLAGLTAGRIKDLIMVWFVLKMTIKVKSMYCQYEKAQNNYEQ